MRTLHLAWCALTIGLALAGARGALAQGNAATLADPLREPFVLMGLGEKIDSYLEARAPEGFSGTVFVYRNGLVLLHKAYGEADRERHSPNTVHTLFPIGSIERRFLVAALLRLEADGKLRIDGPTQALLEERGGKDPRASIARLTDLIETASGEPIRAYLKKGIFEPAGMTETTFIEALQETGASAARGYTVPRGASRLLERFSYLAPISGSALRRNASRLRGVAVESTGAADLGVCGILTTAADLFRFEIALQGTRVLPPEARARLREWSGRREGRDERTRVDGACPGYRATISRDARGTSIKVVLLNNDLGWDAAIVNGIDRRISGDSDVWLTFTVLAISVSALLLILGVTQRGKRGSFGKRSRPNLFPW